MAITRFRSKMKPKSPKNSPKNSPKPKSPKSKDASPVATPQSTPSKKAKDITPKANVTKPSPLKKEIAVENNKEEEFELPSDSDSDSDNSDDEALDGFKSDEEEIQEQAKREFKSERKQIDKDIKSVITHEVKTQLTLVNNLSSAITKNKKKTGIIYIGRLPRGFEEYELKKYFEQFGKILNLRVSRNKKTGRSKHYGFVEFENYQVAKIAAETMNNYLIFGHIIKVSMLTKEKQELFKNANTKFKVIPWLRISKANNDKAKKIENWELLQKKSDLNKLNKFKKLKEMGIDYSL